MATSAPVIPAKAGIQYAAASPWGKSPIFSPKACDYWIPAFAGMTSGRRFRPNIREVNWLFIQQGRRAASAELAMTG